LGCRQSRRLILKPKGKPVKTNIVIFEMNPEVLDVFRVPETAVSAEVLNALAGLYFNCDDVTDEDWSNFDVVNVAVSEEMRASNGVEKLDFPFQPLPGETVFRVFMAM
jgi:hypothetical protein